MNAVISEHPNRYHFTPQISKNRRSLQIQKITQRISLLKHQLQKQKRETSLDQDHLERINTLSQTFQKKVLQEIGKCKELKTIELKTDENAFLNNLRTQIKNTTLKSNKNLYNSHRLNSKTNLNSHIISNQTQTSNKLSQNSERETKNQKVKNKRSTTSKELSSKGMKNTGQNEKNSNFYLKETFLTSIIFVVLGTVFRQILPIV